MQPVFAQSTVSPQRPGDPGYEALLQAATEPVRAQFGDAIQVEVERLDRLGQWAFLQGTMHGADGGRPDYAGTPWAERAAAGGMSDVYVALLQATGPASDDAAAATSGRALDDAEDAGAADAPSAQAVDGEPVEWTLVDHSIGPSDVSWLTWPQAHAAPRQLFGF